MKIISKIINYIFFNTQSRIINHNKSIFNSHSRDEKVLIEFNNWAPLHVSFSYLAQYLSKKFNASIDAFTGYTLISEKLDKPIVNKIKFYIGKKLHLKTFGVYKSFGVSNIFYFTLNKKIEIKSTKIFNRIKKKIKSSSDILNIKIKDVLVGDLIYDTYLAKNKIPTINHQDIDFEKFLLDTIKYFICWEEYINNNKIKAVITSHSTYTRAIPSRIAIKKNIPSFVCLPNAIYRLSKKNYLCETEFFEFKKKFLSLSSYEKKNRFGRSKKKNQLKIKRKSRC